MKKILLITASIILSISLSAQYYYVPNTNNPGNPGGLNADPEYPVGGGMATGWTSILGPSQTSAAWSPAQTIPFLFNFNGTAVTEYKVSSSGVLTFDIATTTIPSYSNSAIPSASIPDNSVMIWGIQGSGANDEIVTKTFGTAGSKQHWIFFSSYTFGGQQWSYWSIVLEEGSDKIYIVDQRSNGPVSVTAGIQINSTTAFSVATSPSLTTLSTNMPEVDDNNYYEFIYGNQPNDDAALSSLNITPYSIAPATISIEGDITNLGGNTINAMDITWSDGTNSYTDNLTGLNIASFGTYSFTHADQLSLTSPGSVNITVTIDNVNTNIDPNMNNNTLTTTANAVTFIPTKRVVFEEATGTWCGWCPRGAVALETLQQQYPNTAIGIAVHNGSSDPMVNTTYDSGMNVGGYPSGHVDRAILDIDPGDFVQYYNDRINEVSPVEISATAVFDPSTRIIDINLSAEFVATLSGSYRFNAVILEDGVGPHNQANYYSGGGAGPLVSPITGTDWANSPDPVSVYFDHVAREILGGFNGTAGSLPATITAGGVHTHNYTHTLPQGQDENKVHVVGMIIDISTGEILNGVKVELSGFTPASWDCGTGGVCADPGTGLGQYTSLADCQANCIASWNCTAGACIDPGDGSGVFNSITLCQLVCTPTEISEETANIMTYPNPAKDQLNIKGEYKSANIYDIYGKLVLKKQGKQVINITSLSNGVYFIKITTNEDEVTTRKITINR